MIRVLSLVSHIFLHNGFPGINEWPIQLLKRFLDVIGADLSLTLEESRTTGKIFCPFNSTFIDTIPKTDSPLSYDSYRPKSLCNCVYKIIAKVITRRLKPILSSIISKKQFGVFGEEADFFKQRAYPKKSSFLLKRRSFLPLL
jgi:hypothetical protein